MNKHIRSFTVILSLLLILLTGLQAGPVYGKADSPQSGLTETTVKSENPQNVPIQFDMFDRSKGWLFLNGELFITRDEGDHWENITPDNLPAGHHAVDMDTSGNGSIISLVPMDEDVLTAIYTTNDYGQNWEEKQNNLRSVLLENEVLPVSAVYSQWLNNDEGWLMVKRVSSANFSHGVLFHTENGGKDWMALPAPAGERFVFFNSQLGYMQRHDTNESFYYTMDGGNNWQDYILPADALEGAPFSIELPVLLKEGGFFLPVNITLNQDRRQLAVFHTRARQASLDEAMDEPFSLITADTIGDLQINDETEFLSLDSQTISFLNQDQGWGLFEGGNCNKDESGITCEKILELQTTSDGGKNWQAITLPTGKIQDVKTYVYEGPQEVNNQILTGQVVYYNGHAFDTCEIPTLTQLNKWYSSSPYRGVNMYIGGISRFCGNSSLNKDYIKEIGNQGWRLIPTWAGHQPPCGSYRNPFPYNVDQAYAYGVQNADQAKERMAEYGLLDSNQRGGLIYLDVEYFNTSNTACVAATQAFVQGWTTRLNSLGIGSGLYMTSSNLNRAKIYELNPPPAVVWIAEWSSTPGYNPNASPYGLRHLPDYHWSNHQRIRQYSGGSNETWGGVTLNIDPNVSDGMVMAMANLPPKKPTVSATITAEKGIGDWYRTQVNITITAIDGSVGISKVYRKIDDGPWREYYQPFGVNGSGQKTVSFYAVNNAGVRSDVQSISFFVDNQPPINPYVSDIGCGAINGVPQSRCNDVSFKLSGAYDAGVGLNPENTYQVYWGTNPNGTSTNTQATPYYNPPAVPPQTPYYLRIRTQDSHGIWSEWQTIFTLIYDPAYKYINWLSPLLRK